MLKEHKATPAFKEYMKQYEKNQRTPGLQYFTATDFQKFKGGWQDSHIEDECSESDGQNLECMLDEMDAHNIQERSQELFENTRSPPGLSLNSSARSLSS